MSKPLLRMAPNGRILDEHGDPARLDDIESGYANVLMGHQSATKSPIKHLKTLAMIVADIYKNAITNAYIGMHNKYLFKIWEFEGTIPTEYLEKIADALEEIGPFSQSDKKAAQKEPPPGE